MAEAQEAAEALSALAAGHPDAQDGTTPHGDAPIPFENPYTSAEEPRATDDGLGNTEDSSQPQIAVKEEPPQTPRLATPSGTLDSTAKDVDAETAKAIAAAQNEYGTRVRGAKKQDKDMIPITDVDMSDAALNTAPKSGSTTKKRSAPKSASAAAGATPPGIKKPPPKKRKVEPSDDRSTPASSKQSPTPSTVSATTSSKAAATSKRGKVSRSATPRASSPAASDASDDQVYCICRKPDDHTFMIGCDGGCDDWFHGRCVKISKDDESLIDKFVCPNCAEKGVGVTTWKPMCRRDGCRKPARLRKGEESKYCSTECGVVFMKGMLKRAAGESDGLSPSKRRRASKELPNVGRLELREPADADIGPLGGRIRNDELNALAQTTATVEEFRNLGSAPLLTPPPSSTSPETTINVKSEDDDKPDQPFTDQEATRLAEIADQKAALRQQRQILKDRSQFITFMRAQRDKTAERMKVKDICGFDSRWSLDDLEFKAWRDSDEGRTAFDQGTLDAGDEDAKPNGVTSVSPPTADEIASHICTRKRCERHRQWQKLVLQDVRFEETDVGNEMRKIDSEETDIRHRAAERAKRGENGVAGEQQSSEGWAEAVSVESEDQPTAGDAMEVDGPPGVEVDAGRDAHSRGVESS